MWCGAVSIHDKHSVYRYADKNLNSQITILQKRNHL
jgi:hypothetical protein